jgi:guanylate kinase
MLCNAVVQALRSNKRIDGLYLYIKTSSAEVLAARQEQRLCEDASTLTKRVTWAKQQMAKSSAPGLFDAVIPNTRLSEVRAATAVQSTVSNTPHCDTRMCITACYTWCGGCRF